MPLPFEDDNKGKRKYQCFVCGVAFTGFQEFSSHIKDTHEEGREYIVCPLEHCKAPVRDIPMHFAVKHQRTPLPKIGMLRAIVWKDVSPKGKTKTRKPHFREGYYESNKMNKRFHYRSGYECTVYECLDADKDVRAFNVEPFEIPYFHKGERHTYTPDIVVQYTDGLTEVIEVKPMEQTSLEKNKDKWHAAAQACKVRGWEFKVVTEVGIAKWKKKVKDQ